MSMLPLFETEVEGGYRFIKSEFLNWGTFDSIWEISPNGNSSLLTGANGSGKTTIVDIINTLLVPPTVRHYNQSSGAIRKKERTEESYILGAYGNIKDEESSYVKVQYLRDKSTYSVITGIFHDKNSGKYKTLGQIRYFSSTTLVKVYFIADENLKLQDDILPFDNKGEFKRRLTRRGVKFFDSFLSYSTAFIRDFGFKSTKALNLFSQTVGVKVLGDINDFIRNHMLERGDIQNKFDGIYQNFLHLMNTQKLIEKAELELELLKKVDNNGKKYIKLRDDLELLDNKIEVFNLFEADVKLKELEVQISKDTGALEREQTELEKNKIRQEDLKDKIRESQRSLDSNTSAEQLRSLEKESKIQERGISSRKKSWEQYDYFNRELGFQSVTEKKAYENLKKTQEELLTKLQLTELDLNEEYYKLRDTSTQNADELKTLTREFDSLKKRDSNIPLKNIELRDRIAKGIGLEPHELPFAGECIRVKESEQHWEKGIERVLHSFSLSLLVDHTLYNRVNSYINQNNLRGRIVYFRVTESYSSIFQNRLDEKSLINKVDVKSSSPYREWITSRLVESFNYICTDDLKEFARLEFGVTSNGLIKRGSRNEKDDREFNSYILGWDNLKKRAKLEKEIIKLRQDKNLNDQKLEEISNERKDTIEKTRIISTLLNYSFESIDFLSLEIELKELQILKERLLAAATDLKILEKNLRDLTEEESSLNEEITEINRKIGILGYNLEKNRTTAQKHRDFIEGYNRTEHIDNTLNLLEIELKKTGNSITELKESILKNIRTIQQQRESSLSRLINSMSAFINPSRQILTQYPSWSEDVRDLKPESEYLEDFRELYKRIQQNDLPQYKKKFKEFLNQRVLEDMASFQQSLNDELSQIKEHIRELNRSLKAIRYQENPGTYITLNTELTKDVIIKEFQRELKNTFADGFKLASGDFREMELFFERSGKLLSALKEDENRRKKVLDVRMWLNFSAEERYLEDNTLKQVYQDSQSLSGGEKAKLAYTVLASAIAHQFGIESKGNSFRFVVVDEAFSKVDPANSRFAMNLFKKLDLQLMVVTPLDRIGLVEEYIDSVHYVEKGENNSTMVYNMAFQEFSEKKEAYRSDKL